MAKLLFMKNVSAVAISGNCGNLVIICCLKREILLEEEQLTTLSLLLVVFSGLVGLFLQLWM